MNDSCFLKNNNKAINETRILLFQTPMWNSEKQHAMWSTDTRARMQFSECWITVNIVRITRTKDKTHSGSHYTKIRLIQQINRQIWLIWDFFIPRFSFCWEYCIFSFFVVKKNACAVIRRIDSHKYSPTSFAEQKHTYTPFPPCLGENHKHGSKRRNLLRNVKNYPGRSTVL